MSFRRTFSKWEHKFGLEQYDCHDYCAVKFKNSITFSQFFSNILSWNRHTGFLPFVSTGTRWHGNDPHDNILFLLVCVQLTILSVVGRLAYWKTVISLNCGNCPHSGMHTLHSSLTSMIRVTKSTREHREENNFEG